MLSFSSSAAVEVGKAPPDYLGTDFQDRPVTVSQFHGKIVVVTFWASWCAPCRVEMGLLEKVQRAAGREALEVVAVNFNEDERMWKAFKDKLANVELTITHDAKRKVPETFDVKSIPRMLMIDRQGLVAHIHEGYDEKNLDAILEELNALLASDSSSE